jgi:hypothetical protein
MRAEGDFSLGSLEQTKAANDLVIERPRCPSQIPERFKSSEPEEQQK